MKPSEWEPSTGLVSLKYAGEPKTAKTKTPPGLETGLDASDNIHVSSEGRGRIFFLTSPFDFAAAQFAPFYLSIVPFGCRIP